MDERQGDPLQAELRAWRQEHTRATFTEIEAAVDGRLYALRARLLEELASASAARGGDGEARAERPRCPVCGAKAVREGQRERRLTTSGDETITLRRDYATCPTCKAGFFPPG